ncbi:RagB/SusD family nutrient uptake outer membrane protein [Paraflavitalea pollutisoli]|uniref:RagB/SusD family nutrient uptake outer membrane protein n=1 Tax=Paraflavitalea pollutisoli TaxID=3034143 RepID=UPI0023EB4B97|nr:RagB/SusD family nutrient uptake outer membrane protein [Paraflavitalea sp. H1-2-19X]
MRTIKQLGKWMLLLAVPLLIALSCGKSFLDVPPQGQITEEQVLTDPNAATNLVTGVYNTLYFGGFGNNTVGFLMAFAGDVTSDNSDKGSTAGDYSAGGQLDNFTFTPANDIFNNLWLGHYQAIARTNKAIDILNTSTIDETVKRRLLGEVRFLRGLYYFNLVRMFGGVPKITRVLTPAEVNSDEIQIRASAADIYKLIEEDLQYGVDNLPVKGDAGATIGRATKGAAQGLLAKVYLYEKNYQKAFDLSSAVITSGRYALTDDYAGMFREVGANNSESIFEVQTGTHRGQTNCDAVSQIYSNGQGPRSKAAWRNNVNGLQYDGDLGFGLNTPSADLANAYEPGDTRRAGTIIFINATGGANAGTLLWDGFRIPTQDSVENQRYNYKAYHSPFRETASCNGYTDKDYKPKNIRILRYAEVVLIYAEAAARLGNGDGTTKLNELRAKRNLGTTTGTVDNVWKERRVELAMEHDRFFDLVRQGRAGTVMRAHGKAFVDGKHELFPIPQIQRDLSGNRLTQNPNY